MHRVIRREDGMLSLPQSAIAPIPINIESEYCYVWHFWPKHRDFKNPEITAFWNTSLQEFIRIKAWIVLRISGNELLSDNTRMPGYFQWRKVQVKNAVDYLLTNDRWARWILVVDQVSASLIMKQYNILSCSSGSAIQKG